MAIAAQVTAPTDGRSKFQRLYNFVGFKKRYNFTLWFIFAGALFGFTLARLMYLNISGVFCGPASGANTAAPGECYYYQNFNRYKIGIRLHLYTILPASLLVVLQFTPAIRQKWRLVHRINGYVIVLLALIANAGAIMIAREAFGGTMATQSWIGALFILTTVGLGLAIYNIKMLQIDQHRAWMLRTWFYFSSIITLRIIMIISAQIISAAGDFWSVQNCAKLLDVIGDATTLVERYPSCSSLINDGNLKAVAAVNANFGGSTVELMSAMNLSFGMAGWLATSLHAIGVEVYLHLTPKESERLRQVSYQRQLEAGFKNAGHAGLVARHSSIETLACASEVEGRKPSTLSGGLSEGEKV
ncbi:hypothetical protein Q7P35_001449 [Cladosporium inversicolor]